MVEGTACRKAGSFVSARDLLCKRRPRADINRLSFLRRQWSVIPTKEESQRLTNQEETLDGSLVISTKTAVCHSDEGGISKTIKLRANSWRIACHSHEDSGLSFFYLRWYSTKKKHAAVVSCVWVKWVGKRPTAPTVGKNNYID